MKSRAQQIDSATKRAFYTSRRPRRAKILQVPTYDAPARGTGTMRPVVVPYPIRPIDWEAAREQGKAYGRVLDNLPKYDRDFEAKQRAFNIRMAEARKENKGKPEPERYKKDPRGMWWLDKLGDVVDRRKRTTLPAYRARGLRVTREHARRYKETKPQPAAE